MLSVNTGGSQMSAPSRGTQNSGTHNTSEPLNQPLEKADSCLKGANTIAKDINYGGVPYSNFRVQENGFDNALFTDVVDRKQTNSSGIVII